MLASTARHPALDLSSLKRSFFTSQEDRRPSRLQKGLLIAAGIALLSYWVSQPWPPKLLKAEFDLAGQKRQIVLTGPDVKKAIEKGDRYLFVELNRLPFTADTVMNQSIIGDTTGLVEYLQNWRIPGSVIAYTVIPLSNLQPVSIWSSSP